MTDQEYMRMAMELAEKGCGFTAPNPMVGAVIVKDDVIIGRGWHQKYGELHAERNALKDCKVTPQGATLYVTLEPCCHYGKTPPCTEAIIESGISRVVIGSMDPNPLRAHGIEVVEGVLEAECDKLNEVFFYYIRTGKPFVVMKYAMTMDGKIATCTGASKWITGEKARERVQMDRHRYSAIMVGVGTVLRDDPMLTCHMEHGRDPVRIVCDTHLQTPVQSQIAQTADKVMTIIATSSEDQDKQEVFQKLGCKILVLPQRNGHIDIDALMDALGSMEIDSILLEGGGTLNWSVLEAGWVRKVQCYIAPKLFGGCDAKTPLEGKGISDPGKAYQIVYQDIIVLGEDILIEGEVESKCLQELLRK